MAEGWRAFTYRSADGLELAVRDYGPQTGRDLPVVCLPGLSRSSRDFHDLAMRLSADPYRPRRVLAFDYRGRGASQYDPNPANYAIPVEMADLQHGLELLGIGRAIFVGTSRGGLITLLLAGVAPALIAGVVFNDIGPVVEAEGLVEIKAYLGKAPTPADWPAAVAAMRAVHGAHFPGLSEADWESWTRATYREDAGRPAADFDRALAATLDPIQPGMTLPAMWEQFAALCDVPVLALRGEHSALLAEATLAEMARRHPRFAALTAPGQGHPVLLRGPVLDTIAVFVATIV